MWVEQFGFLSTLLFQAFLYRNDEIDYFSIVEDMY